MRLHLNDEYTGLMLEIPVPAGMLLPSIDSVRTPFFFFLLCQVVSPLHQVKVSHSNVTKEFNAVLKVISIFFHSASSATPISVDVKLEPCAFSFHFLSLTAILPVIIGTVTANPCRAYLMYSPDSLAVSPSTALCIVAEDGH